MRRELISLVPMLALPLLAAACIEEAESPVRPVTSADPAVIADAAPPSLVSDLENQPDAAAEPSTAAGTTYVEHVRPILNESCVPCHSDGQIAPFSLDTYERAKTFAPLIAQVTRARTMPPSVIDNSGECNTFRDVPFLTDAQIATLGRWAEAGAPEGDATLPAPAPHVLPKLTGEVLTITTPAYVPSTKEPDDWRCFVVDSPFEEETFLTGFDTRPGDKETAHHMVVFYPMDDVSALLGRVMDDLEPGPGYTCFGSPGTPATILAAWAPGGGATLYPDKLGIKVQPGRPLIVQMHYNTASTPMPGEDRTAIDLQVQKSGIAPGFFTQVLDLEMNLPPGEKDTHEHVVGTVKDQVPELNGPVQIYGVFPHMHELGKTQRLTVSRAGQAETCLVDAPRYDFHWQRMYFFDEPITVDATDKLNIDCGFDTSSRKEITKWGESTQDEMCVTGIFIKL